MSILNLPAGFYIDSEKRGSFRKIYAVEEDIVVVFEMFGQYLLQAAKFRKTNSSAFSKMYPSSEHEIVKIDHKTITAVIHDSNHGMYTYFKTF